MCVFQRELWEHRSSARQCGCCYVALEICSWPQCSRVSCLFCLWMWIYRCRKNNRPNYGMLLFVSPLQICLSHFISDWRRRVGAGRLLSWEVQLYVQGILALIRQTTMSLSTNESFDVICFVTMSINLQVMNMGPSKALDARVKISLPLMLVPYKYQLIRITDLQVRFTYAIMHLGSVMKWMLLFCKKALNWSTVTVKTFIVLQKISIKK